MQTSDRDCRQTESGLNPTRNPFITPPLHNSSTVFSWTQQWMTRIQRWSLPSHPLHVLSLCATESPGLTEMEGLLFHSAPRGLLMVSKWSPPATALIIRDPSCMLEDQRTVAGVGSCSAFFGCVSSQEKGSEDRHKEKMKKDFVPAELRISVLSFCLYTQMDVWNNRFRYHVYLDLFFSWVI